MDEDDYFGAQCTHSSVTSEYRKAVGIQKKLELSDNVRLSGLGWYEMRRKVLCGL
jgi:hypothetical protein